MQTYQLIIIGGGPAGYLAAERASQSGMKVALIEERRLGGVCLNEGCIPTKTLLHSSKICDYAKSASKYGINADNVSINQMDVLTRKQRVVQLLIKGVEAKMRDNDVAVLSGTGQIAGYENGVFKIRANDLEYKAEKLLIATGSEPIVPAIKGIDQSIESGFVITSREILELADPPKRLAILGGGVIGLEMAAYYNAIGSQVTVFEMLDHIAGDAEPEIRNALQKNYSDQGIEFLLSSRVTAVDNRKIEYEQDGKLNERYVDKVLLSVGRKPRVKNLGLEAIGVTLKNGRLETDEHMCTNIPGIYAAGDVNGEFMLAHAAYREAEVAVNHMSGKQDRIRYKAIPSVIYSNPEVASVGETEASAVKKGYIIKTVTIPMNFSGRYIAEVEKRDGLCKIVVDTENNRLLGVHLYGSYASEIILSAAMMIEMELRIEDIKELVFPHPTVGEIIREAIFKL